MASSRVHDACLFLVAPSLCCCLALVVAAAVAVVGLTGCRPADQRNPDAGIAGVDAAALPSDAGANDASEPADAATPDTGATPDDAGARRPLPATVVATAPSLPGALTLERERSTPEVPPDARFEVDMPRMIDVRVRLFDETDRVVPSEDRMETAERSRYLLNPTEKLVPGSRYAIVLDALRGDLPTGADGKTFDISRFELRTAGEKPSPGRRRLRSRAPP